MHLRFILLVPGLLALSLGTGCLGDRCSPGQVLREGACVLAVDATVTDGRSADGSLQEAAASGYGATCKKHTDCSGGTTFCVVTLGASSGYCTSTGCTDTAKDCPSPYTCVDLAKFVPGLPAACVKL
jgi:hypothetical protein